MQLCMFQQMASNKHQQMHYQHRLWSEYDHNPIKVLNVYYNPTLFVSIPFCNISSNKVSNGSLLNQTSCSFSTSSRIPLNSPVKRLYAVFPALTCTIGFEGVPHVAVEVIVAGKQQATAFGKGHRGNAADDVVMRVHHQLLVGTQVKEPAGGIVRARGKRIPIGEELGRETDHTN